MKINKTTVANAKSKSTGKVTEVGNVAPIMGAINTPAKNGKTVKAKPTTSAVTKVASAVKSAVKPVLGVMFALLTGKRGYALREVNTRSINGQVVEICAVRSQWGGLLQDQTWCKVENEHLTGHRDALVPVAGYVNGRPTGAKVQFMSAAQFKKMSKPGMRTHVQTGKVIPVRWVGTSAEMAMSGKLPKSMQATLTEYKSFDHAWQNEGDAPAHAKHELGYITPCTEKEYSAAVKAMHAAKVVSK